MLRQAGKTVAAFVLRIDQEEAQRVGVVVVAGSDAGHIDLTASVLPVIETMFVGCDRVRIHTGRAGLAKKLYRVGYETTELVLTKEIKNGQ